MTKESEEKQVFQNQSDDFSIKSILGFDFVLPITLILASILYFTGSEFLDEKARVLGLASAPGEPSLHKTMVVGASVFISKYFLWLFTAFSSVVLLLTLAVRLLYNFLLPPKEKEDFRRELKESIKVAENYRKRLENLKKDNSDGEEIGDSLSELENEIELFAKSRRNKEKIWVIKTKILSNLISFILIVPSAALLVIVMYFGKISGRQEAEEIIAKLEGDCTSCQVFFSNGVEVIGVAAFQSGESIFVAKTGGGIVLLPGDEPITSSPRPKSERELPKADQADHG